MSNALNIHTALRLDLYLYILVLYITINDLSNNQDGCAEIDIYLLFCLSILYQNNVLILKLPTCKIYQIYSFATYVNNI